MYDTENYLAMDGTKATKKYVNRKDNSFYNILLMILLIVYS